MAEAPETGTPTPPEGTDPQGGGTPGAKDDSERGGKPVDAALALSWKQKAERVNEAERQRDEAKAAADEARRRLEEAQRATMGRAVDPEVAYVQDLAERAPYDPSAAAELRARTAEAIAKAEGAVNRSIIASRIPPEHVQAVFEHVQRSGYQMSVADAYRLVVPPSVAEADARAKSIEEENTRLKAELEQARRSRGPGWAGAAPAAPHQGRTIPLAEYRAIMRAGGAEAIKLGAEVDSNAVRVV